MKLKQFFLLLVTMLPLVCAYGDVDPWDYHIDYGCWNTIEIQKGEEITLYSQYDIPTPSKLISIDWAITYPENVHVKITLQDGNYCTVRGEDAGFEAKVWCCMKYGSSSFRAYYIIKVKAAPIVPTGIKVSPATMSLKVGDSQKASYSLTPSNASTTVTWLSDDKNIATVSSSGQVTGISAGTTYIRAKTSNGKIGYCEVTVEPEYVTSIYLNTTSATMMLNETHQLTTTIYPSSATDKSVTWSSDDSSVATVSNSGLVTAKSVGTATITCKANDGSGISASCKIRVTTSYQDGDVFTATTEDGTEMTFKVISAKEKTCQVGKGLSPAIDATKRNVRLVIPPVVNGFKVITIGTSAFFYCDLISVEIPNTVKTIGLTAFYNSGLSSVSIPKSLESIDKSAFDGCSLATVKSYLRKPIEIDADLFGDIPTTATLYVPAGTKSAYESAKGWNVFKNYVEMNTGSGDANSDGVVDDIDVKSVSEYIMGNITKDFDKDAADVNLNGIIDVADIVEIVKIIKAKK